MQQSLAKVHNNRSLILADKFNVGMSIAQVIKETLS